MEGGISGHSQHRARNRVKVGFWKTSGLTEKEEETQVNILVYLMGDEEDDIIHSFRLS